MAAKLAVSKGQTSGQVVKMKVIRTTSPRALAK